MTNNSYQLLWNYLKLNHQLKLADIIIVLCGPDLFVAEYAVNLWKKQLSRSGLIVFSGDKGVSTKHFHTSEAEIFAEVAIKHGIPKENILLETASTNTQENVVFTKNLLNERKIKVKEVIAIQKPWSERRLQATLEKHWREVDAIITSPSDSIEDFSKLANVTIEKIHASILGNIERLLKYPELGFIEKVEVPESILEVYLRLTN